MGNFCRFFRNFFGIFYNFSTIFWKISTIFWKIFAIFLENFYNFLQFFGKFFRKFSLTIRYGSTGVSPYCKFTSKFTPKFTPILIKILQSTKFEGSHFHNLSQLLSSLSLLCAPFPSPPCFLDHSSAMPKVPTAVPPLATSEVCGQYEGL